MFLAEKIDLNKTESLKLLLSATGVKPKMIELCLKLGADPNRKGQNLVTVFNKGLSIDFVKVMLVHGAECPIEYLRKLFEQTKYSDEEIIDIMELIDEYCPFDSSNSLPLYHAIKNDRTDLLIFLLSSYDGSISDVLKNHDTQDDVGAEKCTCGYLWEHFPHFDFSEFD